MTIPDPATAPLLHTDADVLQRVEQLIGTATTVRRLWLVLVDGDGRQSPVLVPIDDVPLHPDARVIGNLAAGLVDLCAELRTDGGGGSVVLVLERIGRHSVLPLDRRWAVALQEACSRAGAVLRGVYLSTSTGVRRIPLVLR
jgi:hypothetical protein